MSTKDIINLPVKEIADDKCILFMWTTDYHLSRCCDVIKAWGFEYKTMGFVWQKLTNNGDPVTFMGNYTMKSGCEICLLATKGGGLQKWIHKRNVRALYQSKREKHSKKPDEFRKRIELMYPGQSKIELFARQKTEGWDIWGDEIESQIKL